MTEPTYDDQVRQLHSIAEELTGYAWTPYPSDLIIEGEVVDLQADGNMKVKTRTGAELEARAPAADVDVVREDPFAAWEVRRAELALIKFYKNAWADLQEGKVESLANRVAQLVRDVPELGLPAAPARRQPREVRIAADIAARYGVDRMLVGWFDDTVRTAPVPSDVDDPELELDKFLVTCRIFGDFDPAEHTITSTDQLPRGRGHFMAVLDDADDPTSLRLETVPARPAPAVETQFWGPVDRSVKRRRKAGRRRG